MYLDDIITLSPDRESAERDFGVVQQLLAELGLPEAPDKHQPPSTRVTWLGVVIDSVEMSLSIPGTKLEEVKSSVSGALRCKSMSKTHLQSVIGRLLHVAKCIRPAWLVSRLLEALRSMTRPYIRVTAEMRKDFLWFQEFCGAWNGIGLIPAPIPSRHIIVDASGSGIGTTDGHVIYGGQVSPVHDPVANIAELEGANIVVALHTMLSEADRGCHVLVSSDSQVAVQIFSSGRGRNRVLLECAWALWMTQSLLDVHITYQHIPGVDNILADALSRVHMDSSHINTINSYVAKYCLKYVFPCLSLFSMLNVPVLSRSVVPIAPGNGLPETAAGQGPGHSKQP